MKYGSLDTIIKELENREQIKQEKLLADSQQKAQEAADKIWHDGLSRLEQRKARARKDIQLREKQEKTRIKIRENQKVNLFKQELIQKELDRAKEYFVQLPEERYLSFLKHVVEETERESKILKISVPKKLFAIVDEEYSENYEVSADDDIQTGFKLFCEEFDVNHEISQMFQFRKQELSRSVMKYLFEDE